jgi:hypothetical protein
MLHSSFIRENRSILVKQLVGDLDAISIRCLKLLQQVCQFCDHSTDPIVFLVVFTVLQVISSQNLQI